MAQQSAQLPHKEKVAGANPARAPISRRGRAANAARCKRAALTGCGGASPSVSTSFCRQSVGSDAPHWYREERSANLRAGSSLCGRGETADAPARGAGGRKPMRVQLPPPAPIYRRVVERIHASLRNSWAQARAGANPVPSTTSTLRPLASRRSASQAGNTGANPVGATNFLPRSSK